MIYFDNSATSLHKPDVVKEAVKDALENLTANSGRSSHYPAQRVGEVVFDVRERVKEFFGAVNFDLIFTKNCTEALNLALRGILNTGDHVVISCYEHNSVLRTLKYLENFGIEVSVVYSDLSEFHKALLDVIKKNTKLVITTAISNVTGESVNVSKVGAICKDKNIFYLVDGAQLAGHKDIDLEKDNVSMFTFSGHKGLLSITGVGGLIVKRGVKLKPLIFGGTGTESENLIQPTDTIEGYEAGTIPTIPIISLGAGVDFLSKNFSKIQKKEEFLSKYLYNSLKSLKFLKIYSNQSSLNVFSFNVGNLDSGMVSDMLNERYGICVRSGLHCAPLIHERNGTLGSGAVRASIDFNNTIEEVDKLISALNEIYLS